MRTLSAIILYDGVCGFCDRSVQFVLRHDRSRRYRFAALQSRVGAELLKTHPTLPRSLDSLILIEGHRAYARTDAVLRIASGLGFPWKLAAALLILPAALRDPFYDAFAKRRYAWFGKLDSCPIPSPGTRERFLDRDEGSTKAL